MKSNALYILLIMLTPFVSFGQGEALEVNGAIHIENSQNPSPDPGTIRWAGSTLEGYDGSQWKVLSNINNASYITDNENNRYEVVTVGTQTWMAENLRSTKFTTTGLDIPLVTDKTEWSNLTGPAYTWYGNTGSESGAMYNYAAVISTKGICPTGWHIPTDAEFQVLSDYLGGDDVSGTKIKESGIEHWIYSLGFIDGNNESGMSAIPGGYRTSAGVFAFGRDRSYWWSSTRPSPSSAPRARLVERNTNKFRNIGFNADSGLSVRCIKD